MRWVEITGSWIMVGVFYQTLAGHVTGTVSHWSVEEFGKWALCWIVTQT